MEKQLYDLTAPQKSIWLTEQYFTNTNINNICGTAIVSQLLDFNILNEAINLVIKNNDIFRLHFIEKSGVLKQYFGNFESKPIEIVELDSKEEISTLEQKLLSKVFDLNEELYEFKMFRVKNSAISGYMLNIHHIKSDALTLGLCCKKIMQQYIALVNNETLETNEKATYENYINSEAEYIASKKYEADKNYWEEKFKELPNIVTIPTTKKDSTDFSCKANRYNYIIDKNKMSKIIEFCTKSKISVFNLFMGILSVYMYRVNNINDFVIGTPILNRTNFTEKNTLGMFINVAPLRVNINDNSSILELLSNIATDSMGLLRHQKYSYQSILENIRKTNPSIPNLYNIVLSYQITKANVESNISYETRWAFNGTCLNDIDIHLFDLDNTGELNISYDYKVDKYDEQDIIDLNNRLNYIIDQVLENSDIKIKELEIATPSERDRILNEFNNTKTDYPSDKTIVELFEEQVELHPDNIAVVFEDEKLTYRELNEKANQLARDLVEKNINKKIIAIYLNKSIEYIISILAVLKSGNIFMPISCDYPKDRVKYMIKNSVAPIIISKKQYLSNIEYTIPIIDIEKFNFINKSKNLELSIIPSNLAYIIYTSGSTGLPKAVAVSHTSLVNHIYGIQNRFNNCISTNDIALSIANISFDANIQEIFIPLLFGATLHILEDNFIYNTIELAKYIYINKITFTFIPPTLLDILYDELCKYDKVYINKMLVGVQAIYNTTLNNYFNFNPQMQIHNGYGPTEATICCTSYMYNEKNDNTKFIIPIGKPMNNCEVYILDDFEKLQPPLVTGEICISGDCLSNGYIKLPEKTKEKFTFIKSINKFVYKTGDLAYFMKDGNIQFIGRKDNQIKLHGFRIELEEINSVISENSKIKSSYTLLYNENQISSFVIPKNKQEFNINELKSYLKEKLPYYMIPTNIIPIEKIPYNKNGKVDCSYLIDLLKTSPNLDNKCFIEAKSQTDIKISSILKELLHLDKINFNNNIFELGGDSLSAIKLCSAIKNEFNIDVTVKEVFELKNIKELTKYIDTKISNNQNIETFLYFGNSDYYPISSAQKRIYYASNMSNSNLGVYNISGGIEFYDILDFDKIKCTLNQLVSRHESFRTFFEISDCEIHQKISTNINLNIDFINTSVDDIDNQFKLFNKNFDLSKAPLLKAKVLYLDNNHTVLLVSMHHIISDGTSMNILLDEFCKLYNNEALPKIKFTYKDFINYEQYFSGSEKYENNKNFWLNEFADEIPTLNLPTNFSRPSIFSYKGAKVYNRFNEEISSYILETSKRLQVTPYMFLLAAYYILLYKYTGQDNIIVGTPIANRDISEFSNIIGMFVNTLAIRKKINSNKTFMNFLEEIKEKCLNCFTHQNYPFDELVKELNISRDASRNPLFDTMFVYQNTGMKPLKLNNIETKYYIPDTHISKFDLSLEITPQDKEFLLNLEYCTDLFEKEFIEALSEHYIQLVKNILDNVNSKISDLEFLTIKEKNLIFNNFNNTKLYIPQEQNLLDMFKNIVNKYPNNIAVELNNQKISYKELDCKSNTLAQILIENGVKNKSVVGVYLNKSIELIVSIWAILKIGAIYMPMYSKYPENRLEYMIQNSKSDIIITNSKFEKNINLKINKIIFNDFIQLEDYETEIQNTVSFDYIAYIIYTSGSTGKPKGVQIKHSNLVNFIYSFNKFYNNTISTKDIFLSSTNISFDVSIWEIFLPLLNGAKLVLYNEETIQDIVNYTNYIIDNKITGLYIPPNILNEVYTLLKNKKVYIEKLLVGVESIKKSTLNKYLSLNSNMLIINGYGPTETTICATAFDYKFDNTDDNFVSIGKPLYNNHIYILNKDLKQQPIGIPGEIYITGKGVGNGYINIQKENNFLQNIFDSSSSYMYKTGDFAKWNKDGTITFIGRNDSQIKISGYRIELEEIENKILEFPNIKKAVTLCQTDYKNRKYLVTYLTVNDKISINKLKEHLRKYLPKYMIPSYFEILNEFPYTPNGKVDKKLLPLPDIQKNQQDFIPARNNLDKKILQIFEKLLNISPIGITDNFFELGGDSLLAINLQIELMKITDGISYADIFLNPTIKELTDKINNINNVAESLTSTIDLLNCNTAIQNYTQLPTNIEKKNIGNILLTGATGYLGIHVLNEFLENETGKIYCLIRSEKGLALEEKLLNKLHFYFDNKFDNLLNDRIIIINGDITLPNLGLSETNYNELNANISTIINCAAKVSHFGKYELYKKINVDGVQNLIDFCKENKKTLYHISTTSVSGEKLNTDDSLNISTNIFKENNFFINQIFDNVYVKSKFEAEKLIISELQNGLDAYILRIGNLMGRFSDGRFQQNIEENAYVNRLLSFIRIRHVPNYFLEHTLEFTPVDYCANAIVKFITHRTSNNRIFHLLDNNRILIKDLLNIFEQNYFKITPVSNAEFKTLINSLLKSNHYTNYLNGIISDFDKNKNLDYIQKIQIFSDFSNDYLNKINFAWPNINELYITKFFKYLNNLYKF